MAVVAVLAVQAAGTLGYWGLGLSPLDAWYQTVTTVSTVGFRELFPLTTAAKAFTIALVLVGVATTLYMFGVLLEAVIEGQLRELLGRRRMGRRISELRDHVILCGWGRTGRSVASHLAADGQALVVVDRDAALLEDAPSPTLVGDATDDEVLRQAGIDRARALVAAVSSDADNLYVTLSARSLRPDLFIVARVRVTASEDKLRRAGADRVVNPQAIGGRRMAAMLLQPHVAEFVDVVTPGTALEFRLAELPVGEESALADHTLAESHLRSRTGALVLALRELDGRFNPNPHPTTMLAAGQILIAIGTAGQLEALAALAG